MNASVAQLEEEFKKFGPIKSNGIQVRSNKQQGFCFGFVEFESLDSMHSAIKAPSIAIGTFTCDSKCQSCQLPTI
ncbi:nuclear transport factor 2-like [Lactuca sativa]|uniref:nuclear transport factor 2-like n=1 Tax=Lactuca sativa TaxID=4236 RepID=UPI0022AFED3A|nr:nuclear transport factor 2-like [Lactuca sativa]